jgi:hypothetical protein
MTKKEQTRVVEVPGPSKAPGQFKHIAGSNADAFNQQIAGQLLLSIWRGADGKDDVTRGEQAMLFAMMASKPADEIEGMLIAQMTACHFAAMECFRCLAIPGQSIEASKINLTFANKLSRTFTSHLETLDKHRGKGQQKVTVEHVHVHQGGQAIVGTVETGAGVKQKPEEQPHAKQITNAPQPALRSTDTQREAVPVASDGK